MRETLIISSRGQITLPAGMRKSLGLTGGSAVIVEERDGELALKPAAVIAIENYSDADIVAWDAADQLGEEERNRILKALQTA